MKIAFIIEYFPPYAPGGAEWSSYYLAKDLAKKKNIEIFVLTPNYGYKTYEEKNNIRIYRFPFYKKLNEKENLPGTFYYTNPIWFLWLSWHIYKFVKKNKIDIIHVHGKFSVPSACFANLFLGKAVLATIRDYQPICNYGFCLYEKEKACNLKEYFFGDFKYYINHYLKTKNYMSIFTNLLYAIWGRIARNILKFFSQNIPIVVLSQKQKEIFVKNGFNKLEVVGNSVDFAKKIPKAEIQNVIVFAGRLTPGKGVEILTDMLPKFFAKFPNYNFYFAGEDFLKKNLLGLSKDEERIKVLSQLNHQKLLSLFAKSKAVVIPSIWPEPFGRIAIEALSRGTPIVVSNRGGLPEIVKDGQLGYVVKPETDDVLEGIKKVIKNNQKLRFTIKKHFSQIQKRLSHSITKQYLEIYIESLR